MFLKKDEIIDKIFYITIAIYFVFSGMTVTMLEYNDVISLIAKMMRYVCYASFAFIIICNVINLNERITIKSIIKDFAIYLSEHVILVFILTNTVIVLLTTGVRNLLVMVFLIWACSFYDFQKVIQMYFKAMFGFMLCTWLCSILELVPEITVWRGERLRYSIGFAYPLETMTFYLFLVVCYAYIKNKDFSLRDFVEVNIIGALLFVATDARTSFYLVVGVSAIALLFAKTRVEELLKKISEKLYCLIPIVCASASILGGMCYDPSKEIWLKLDSAVSGRLKLTNNAFNTYGFSLFGEQIKWVGFGGLQDTSQVATTYNFVDSSYAKMLLDYGIVFTIVVLIGYVSIYKWAIKRQEYMLVVAVSVVLVVSIMEPRLLSIEMNPFLLLLGCFFMKENRSRFRFIVSDRK